MTVKESCSLRAGTWEYNSGTGEDDSEGILFASRLYAWQTGTISPIQAGPSILQ